MPKKNFKYYPIILTIIVAIQMMCFFLSKRQIQFFNLSVNGSGLLFPLDIYLFEIIGYCYGYEYSRQAVWVNMVAHIGFFIIIFVVNLLPYANGMHQNYIDAYNTIFKFSYWMIIGSILGEFVGDFFSAIIVPKSKLKFQGRYSSFIIFFVHLISSFLVVSIAYIITNLPDGYTMLEIFKLIIGTMVIKTLIAIIMFPIAKKLINFIKISEGVDIYDNNQTYSFFRFNPDLKKIKYVAFEGKYNVKKNNIN